MNVKWLGQAAFLITTQDGTKILIDPFTPSERIPYNEITESADVVTISHTHADHSNAAAVKGNPVILREGGEAKGIMFRSVSAFHDREGGAQRGAMTIFCFEADGLSLCHMGDLGHVLNEEQIKQIGRVDILFTPVGGNFSLDAAGAAENARLLNAKIIIPMHYRNARTPNFPVATVDDFIAGKPNVTRLGVSEVEFTAGLLPSAPQIVVLDPSH